MEKILQLDSVRFTYEDGNKEILHGITLDVNKGEFLCVLGHNGSGKSTMAKLLNGLFLPTAGKVFVAGMDTADEAKMLDIRRTAGMVFQNPDNQLVTTIVEDDIAFGPENLGVPPQEIRKRVDDALDAVHMKEFAQSTASKLSGGQKQRIAIAGVLAMRPQVMILDEPTAMLDPLGRREVLENVRELNRQGMTVVYITHFMEEAICADRIAVVNDGTVAMQGTPGQVFADVNQLRRYGLDVPEMAQLAYDLKRAGLSLPDGILSVEEMAEALCQLL